MTVFDHHVFICRRCGRGFLVAQPAGMDQYPEWAVLSSMEGGAVCGGEVRAYDLTTALVMARPKIGEENDSH